MICLQLQQSTPDNKRIEQSSPGKNTEMLQRPSIIKSKKITRLGIQWIDKDVVYVQLSKKYWKINSACLKYPTKQRNKLQRSVVTVNNNLNYQKNQIDSLSTIRFSRAKSLLNMSFQTKSLRKLLNPHKLWVKKLLQKRLNMWKLWQIRQGRKKISPEQLHKLLPNTQPVLISVLKSPIEHKLQQSSLPKEVLIVPQGNLSKMTRRTS